MEVDALLAKVQEMKEGQDNDEHHGAEKEEHEDQPQGGRQLEEIEQELMALKGFGKGYGKGGKGSGGKGENGGKKGGGFQGWCHHCGNGGTGLQIVG